MMKKMILALAIILMFSSTFATYNPDSKEITQTLVRGWNLVPLGFNGPSNISEEALAVYMWAPHLSKYIGGIVKDGSVQDEEMSNQTEALQVYAPNAFWVYMKKDMTITSYPITSQELLTGEGDRIGKKLAKGWNFVGIWPYMTGIKFNDLMGNCNITRMNTWNSAGQKWGQPTSSTEAANQMKSMNQPFSIYDVGKTILLYAQSECEMGSTPAEAMTPPPLPE